MVSALDSKSSGAGSNSGGWTMWCVPEQGT